MILLLTNQAPNLPALVLKIMRGTVEPLPLRYSAGLRQLIASMLALNPADRPDLVICDPLENQFTSRYPETLHRAYSSKDRVQGVSEENKLVCIKATITYESSGGILQGPSF